jgi:hypothetical protein
MFAGSMNLVHLTDAESSTLYAFLYPWCLICHLKGTSFLFCVVLNFSEQNISTGFVSCQSRFQYQEYKIRSVSVTKDNR